MRIETPRLLLRLFAIEDEAVVILLLSDPTFMEWSTRGTRSASNAKQVLREDIQQQDTFGFSKYALIDKQDDEIVGYCGLGTMEIEDQSLTELGYRLALKARGKGFATEAARAVIEDGINRLVMDSMQAIVEPENYPSQRILDKLGFALQRHVVAFDRKWLLYPAGGI